MDASETLIRTAVAMSPAPFLVAAKFSGFER